MKKMKLYSPIVRLTQSQHCKCSWCEAGIDPIREGVCRKCHDKLQAQLSSQKWIRLRQSYLATLETGYCHGFLVHSTVNSPIVLASDTAILRYNTLSAFFQQYLMLYGDGRTSPFFAYHPCHSIVPIAACRIDHTLPWHCYPSLFWQGENHQQLCLDCNAKKTHLDGSHRTNSQRSV